MLPRMILLIAMQGCCALMLCAPSAQAAILTVATRDVVDLDIDGTGTETEGDLGTTLATFFLTGAEIPAEPNFAGITSITITFQAVGGNLSADPGGITPIGIGVFSPGESTQGDVTSLTTGNGERIDVQVSSTSINPGLQVFLTGMVLSSWRNEFPLSEATLTGATINGSNVYGDATDADEFLPFDSLVASFGIASSGTDSIRLKAIGLDTMLVSAAVPEPSSALLGLLGAIAIGMFARNWMRQSA